MPRNIRWDESVKENALNLVEALLYQADDELDDLALKAAVHVEWVRANKLRVTGKEKQTRRKREQVIEVGTKKEHLLKLVNKAGKSLNLPQRKKESGSSQPERELEEVQTALDCLRELGVFEEEKNTRKNQGYWKFTLTLKHQTATREQNLEVVQQKWKEHPRTKPQETSLTTSILETEKSIDWREVCCTRLEKQKQLTTNRLMSAKQMLFDINEICVDLALVERKQTDKRSGDDNPAHSQSYKPDYEETQKLEYEEFLATVLKASPSNKIAIIGEPGAGKTTLLQRIAFWILDKTDGLPIWIPLGNLPTPAPILKDYLLKNWLEDAISSVTPKIRTEFEGLLTAGRVWLLLDGVDEMVANSGNPLSFIDNWIPGWCQQLSVVLTCRLNVWEANPHALNNFQTYRTLEFSQEKVIEFIEACFQNSNPALGTQLQEALNQPGKERIKDLMRNPLRLTLLCSTWHLREGKLPDTKAELYQQFVEEVYRWKKDEFPTEPEEREQLNAKLKELALAAIDKEEYRFCLRHKFVEGILGDRDGSVFQLALNIGWLNRVGVDAKNPNPSQPVYAFFHPTFQEYFAALAIADWDFFLPRAHDNQNPKPVSERYRIFEPQWKEVILLWLGREDVAKAQKEKFTKELVEFEDGCADFYSEQAYDIAAYGIEEFLECSLRNKIIAIEHLPIFETDEIRKIDESLGKKLWGGTLALSISFPSFGLQSRIEAIISSSAFWKSVFKHLGLKRDDVSKFGGRPHALIYLLSTNQIESTSITSAIINSDDIKKIIEYLSDSSNVFIRRLAIKRLLEIVFCSPTAFINALSENSCLSSYEYINRLLFWILEKIPVENSETATALIQLLQNSKDDFLCEKTTAKLKISVQGDILQTVLRELKVCLTDKAYENNLDLQKNCYSLIWHYGQNMSYPTFYQAWHSQPTSTDLDNQATTAVGSNPFTQSLNQADLPQSLQNAIANNPQLSQTIHLICIDGSQFIEPDNPAAKIYTQMVKGGCPKCDDGTPKTMTELQTYWDLLDIEFDKRVVLVFYASSTDTTQDKDTAMPCPYSEAFLTVLSKFGREICVITEQRFDRIPLKFLAPSQAIADVVKWIREMVVEE